MKKFITTLAAVSAAALLCAPSDQAYTGDEQDYLIHLDALGVMSSAGNSDMVTSGWKICTFLAQGYERPWLARQLYQGSQTTNGAAGVDYTTAQGIVYYANADLCPEV